MRPAPWSTRFAGTNGSFRLVQCSDLHLSFALPSNWFAMGVSGESLRLRSRWAARGFLVIFPVNPASKDWIGTRGSDLPPFGPITPYSARAEYTITSRPGAGIANTAEAE